MTKTTTTTKPEDMKGKDWIILLTLPTLLSTLLLLVSALIGWEGSIFGINLTLNKAIKMANALLLFVDLFAMGAAGYIYIRTFVKKKIKSIEEKGRK